MTKLETIRHTRLISITNWHSLSVVPVRFETCNCFASRAVSSMVEELGMKRHTKTMPKQNLNEKLTGPVAWDHEGNW